jgi:UDP-N-acetylmuramate: L-alanyl-gamma-D-glutamyl-meso-diaminopimelate ligase
MHIHILGICGTFMGGLAALAREAGHTVTGCDAGVYPPMSDQLRALGIELIEGFDASQMALKPDVFVIGNVVSRARKPDGTPKFPLMEAILDAGAPYTSGPQWLAEHVLQGRHVLAVAGTHGKTTTTSMLAWILESAGLEPGFLVGGVPVNFGVSARLGGGTAQGFAQVKEEPAQRAGDTEQKPAPSRRHPLFVIEADEYDTAFFDKRSKFVHYRPRTAILNNLEFDHADIFDDLAAIERQFHHLVRTVASTGRVVVNGLEESLTRVLHAGCWSEVRSFGSAVCDFTAEGEPGHFDVLERGVRVATVDWPLGGVHNQLNALAAIAAAEHVGVSPAIAAQALGTFQNVKRRMEVRGTVNGITVYDDFRPPPHGDSHHAGRTAAPGRPERAHPGGVRTAQQHHEARHHEGPAARQPDRCRPGLLPQRRAGLGRARSADPDGRTRPGGRQHRRAGGAGHGQSAARRPHPVHEQWGFWRRARPPAAVTTK